MSFILANLGPHDWYGSASAYKRVLAGVPDIMSKQQLFITPP